MRTIEAVIFDWAGTTVDYGSAAPVAAFAEAFRAYGIVPTVEEVRKPMGIAKIDHVRQMLRMERIGTQWKQIYGREFDESDVQEIYRLSEKKILELLKDYGDPKPFVVDTVQQLRSRNIKIGSTTGYNDAMMAIVAPVAAQKGYAPDVCVTPDSTDHIGRPYPYMIFRNMMELQIRSVDSVIKVGDTLSDIVEGKNAGVIAVGILEGSSILGYSQEEYEGLASSQQTRAKERAAELFRSSGADYVLDNMSGLMELIRQIEGR